MKKAAFNIQAYIVAFLIVSGIIITMGTFAVKLGQNYQGITNNGMVDQFTSTYNKLNSTIQTTQQMQAQLSQSDIGTTDASTQFYGGFIGAIKLIGSSLTLIPSMLQDAATYLHIPALWVTIFIAVIIVLLVTSLLFMILRIQTV